MGEELTKLHAEVRRNHLKSITEWKERDGDSLMTTIRGQNERGDTVIHVGARYGRSEMVEFLIGLCTDSEERGHLLRVANGRGFLAILEAILCGQTQTAMLLLRHHPMQQTADPQSSHPVQAQETSDGIILLTFFYILIC